MAPWSYNHICNDLDSQGYMRNPIDVCVINKLDSGVQCTICIHVDDLLITCVDEKIIECILSEIQNIYKQVTIKRGKVKQYLGRMIDFSVEKNTTSLCRSSLTNWSLNPVFAEWQYTRTWNVVYDTWGNRQARQRQCRILPLDTFDVSISGEKKTSRCTPTGCVFKHQSLYNLYVVTQFSDYLWFVRPINVLLLQLTELPVLLARPEGPEEILVSHYMLQSCNYNHRERRCRGMSLYADGLTRKQEIWVKEVNSCTKIWVVALYFLMISDFCYLTYALRWPHHQVEGLLQRNSKIATWLFLLNVVLHHMQYFNKNVH